MIDLLPDADQQALVTSVTEFLSNEVPVTRLRPAPGSALPPPQQDRWADYAAMGWFGIGLDERLGGIGLGIAEAVLVSREFGRYLASPALLGAQLAAHTLAASDPALCSAILGGKCRVGLAHAGTETTNYLIDAEQADLLLRLDRNSISLFRPSAFDARAKVPALDGALSLERAQLTGTALAFSADPALARSARIMISAMLVGAAEASLKLAVDYAAQREQFGQVIAGFQAIKHLCADLAVRAEAAWAQVLLAALSEHGALMGAGFEAAAAELLARSAAVEVTEQCIQIHGGMGFVVETDAHHFLKRVHLLVKLLGNIRDSQQYMLAEALPA